MLVPFLIMLREGIEAALIVGIIASYLAKTGRRSWMPAVWTGVGLAVVLSLATGFVLNALSAEFPQKQQELFEAVVGLIAVVFLTSMVFWMRKQARSMKSELQGSIEEALSHKAAGVALVGMAFFAVAREGLESVFFLLATFQQDVGLAAPVGAVAGLVLAIAVGIAIYLGGLRLNLRRFFRWTGVFILFVAAGLLAGAVGSLHEAGLWNGLQGVVFDLSHVLPTDSALGAVLAGLLGYNDRPTVGEALAYLLFLVPMLILFFTGHRSAPSSAAAAGLDLQASDARSRA
ncbi:iron uptake transporter permease EfeU [Mangrovicella endophytica]|uniref:iron uptake transporter permease EfeU n=1 Tax=Mangrovicella endophytica TaxID=2066697 RepID=UPI000C9E47D4|nr:iron uptake transporter permease EfeU [Mangrovicella endophytica]